MLVARWRGSNKESAFVSVDAASVSEKTSSPNGCVGCLYGPVSAVVLFDLLIVRLLVIGDMVVILLNLMIWHSNCWDKRSRTVVVPHCTINQWRISEIDDLCLSNSLLSCVHSWTIIVCSRVVEEIYQSVIIFSEKCHQLGDDECADSVAAQSISSSISNRLPANFATQPTTVIDSSIVEYCCSVTELSMRSVLENIAVRLDGIRETVCQQYYYSYLHPCAAHWKEVRNLLLLTMKLHQLLAFSLSGTVLVDALVEPVSLKIEADPRQPK
ncbi:hypothetical protein T09_13296 [Trichinella sp. T9]|nr:hypothetical protein T09_13296 [Trichinella sp. T9]